MKTKAAPTCTVDYDGLYCDGDCARCDELAAQRAEDRREVAS